MKKAMLHMHITTMTVAFCIFPILLILMVACAGIRLEKKLAPEMRAWLATHESIMNTNVPLIVAGESGMSERMYFLKLTPELQARYGEMFWKIRDREARGIFEARLLYTHRHMQGLRYMADLVLLVGLPEEIYVYTEEGAFIGAGSIGDDKGYDHVISIWTYYSATRRIRYGFESKGAAWYVFPMGVEEMSGQLRFEQQWRVFFSPTWNGWDSWLEIIKPKINSDMPAAS